MTESPKESQEGSAKAESGPEIVTAFVRRIAADQTLDRDAVSAIESLHQAGKLTPTNLLKALENARSKDEHGSLTKTRN